MEIRFYFLPVVGFPKKPALEFFLYTVFPDEAACCYICRSSRPSPFVILPRKVYFLSQGNAIKLVQDGSVKPLESLNFEMR